MLAVIQRVSSAAVRVNNELSATIEKGLVIFLGVLKGDDLSDAQYLTKKISELRIFSDQDQKMNLCAKDISGQMLVVSQFTLCANLIGSGRRPSFDQAMAPAEAEKLYLDFIRLLKEMELKVEQGVFRSLMNVEINNDGPVTFILDSKMKPGFVK